NEVHYIDSFLNLSRAESHEAHSSTFTDNLTLLNQLGQRIITFDDDQPSMLAIYEQVKQLVPCSALSLAFYNKESHSLKYKYLIDNGELVKSFEVSCQEVSRIGIHCANNQATVVLDTSTEHEINSYLDEQYKSANSCWVNDEIGVTGTSVITTPVIFEGSLIAVLSIQKDRSHSYNDYHLQVVKQIANYFAMSLTHLKQKQELEDSRIFMEQIYKTDHLTGLKNRFGVKPYLEKLQQANAEHSSITALVLDVDYLKAFNNHYGMASGDNLLVTFSDILNHVSEGKGEVFRVGGDEFVVILPSLESEQAIEVAKEIKAHLKNSGIKNAGAETEHLVTCTIGIIELDKLTDLTKFEQNLFQGERALIRAKKEKRNRLLRYSAA
ncbi:sensor domain-containing diguanylate cyclase, partial [Vibrio makurazakiensis]|uniref:sensor domain-containing diguanylate cyclase n=1 Tax=Vibrio makurazakiensis TaxID=2910250 RepID=UPI003D0F2EC5